MEEKKQVSKAEISADEQKARDARGVLVDKSATKSQKNQWADRNRALCRARILARKGDRAGADAAAESANRIAPLSKRERSQVERIFK